MNALLFSLVLLAPTDIQRIDAPVDASTLAFADLNTRSSFGQPFTRYVWIPSWISQGPAVASQFLNEVVSRNSLIIAPRIIDRSGVKIVRVDFRELAPDPRDQRGTDRDLGPSWNRSTSISNRRRLMRIRISVSSSVKPGRSSSRTGSGTVESSASMAIAFLSRPP